MKLIISTIVVGILLFLLGWLFYGLIFMDYFTKHYAAFQRAPGDMRLWAIAVGCLTQAFFLALIYPKGYKGGSPFGEGLKFGLYIGLLMAVPYVFYMWGEMPIKYLVIIVDSLIMGFDILLAGIVTGLIYGKIEKPAAA